MSAQVRPWLPLALLAATILLLFYRLVMGEVLFWGLPALQFTPWRALTLSELAAGRLPLWNPYNGAGAPLLANYQSAIGYPPNVLLYLIRGPAPLGWLGMAHLLWAGFGMWLFLSALGLTHFGRGVGALAFALNTAVVARFGTVPMLDSAAWLPWLMLAADRVSRSARPTNLVFGALVTGMLLLAGHAQWAFYSLLLATFYVTFRLTTLHETRSIWLRRFGGWVALAGLGAALAAFQLLPTAELQRQSQRSGGADEGFALNYSYELPLLPTLFNPKFYGDPGDGSYLINGAAFESAAYIGCLPALAALVTLLRYPLLRRRAQPPPGTALIPFFGVVLLVSFVFALGKNTPIYVLLFRYVPTFNLFQAPTRWLLWFVFGAAVLAAVGLSAWKADRGYRAWARLLGFGGVVVAILSLALRVATDAPLLNGPLGLGVLFALAGLVLVAQPFPGRGGAARWQMIVLVFIAGDLLWANALSNPTTPPDFYNIAAAADPLRRTWRTPAEIERLMFDDYLRFKDYRTASIEREAYARALLPNMNILAGGDQFNTFEPLRPSGIESFTQLLAEHPAPNLFAAAGITSPDAAAPAPLAWSAPQAIGSAEAFAAMSDPAWDSYKTVFIAGESAPTFSGTQPCAVRLVTRESQAWTVQADCPAQAMLVLAQTYYPGWHASIEGADVPIYRANGAFQAVALPAGAHTIRLDYAPALPKIGALLSLLALAGLAALAIYGARSRRLQSRPQAPR